MGIRIVSERFCGKGIWVTVFLAALMIFPDCIQLNAATPLPVVALKNFNPKRYAALSFANPLPLDDPGNCTKIARDSERTTESGLVWDIFTQVGAWLRSREPSNPLNYGVGQNGKHPVQYLYGWGYSQTGVFLIQQLRRIASK